MRIWPAIITSLIIAISTTSTGQGFPFLAATQSGLVIRTFYPSLSGTGTQRLLNVTVEITNTESLAKNFTITVYWDGIAVATRNVTNFAPEATEWFTLTAPVTFDPMSGHYVGVAAGNAWVAIPVYRPPGYGSSNLPWWDKYRYLVIGSIAAVALAITLMALIIRRRGARDPA